MSTNPSKSGDFFTPCWGRYRGESQVAYAAFCIYRGLEKKGRSLENVHRQLRQSGQFCSLLRLHAWYQRWDWDARVKAFDDEFAREQARRWERRRADSYERGFRLSQKLHDKIEKMLDHPITVQATKTRNTKGRVVAITKVYPAKWNYGNIASLAQAAVQLEAGSILAALAYHDGFDPRTASPEECRAYLVQRGILPEEPAALPPSDPVIDIEPGPMPDNPVV